MASACRPLMLLLIIAGACLLELFDILAAKLQLMLEIFLRDGVMICLMEKCSSAHEHAVRGGREDVEDLLYRGVSSGTCRLFAAQRQPGVSVRFVGYCCSSD